MRWLIRIHNVLRIGAVWLVTAVVSSADVAAQPALVVNEILYRHPVDDLEFLELLNRSDRAVNLGGWTFADARFDPVALPLLTVESGEFIVLVKDSATFSAEFPGVDHMQVSKWPTLNNGGDTVVLLRGGLAVDSVTYDPAWGGNGVSLERLDPDGPSWPASNWLPSTSPFGGTPGKPNTVFSPDDRSPVFLAAEQRVDNSIDVWFDEPLLPEGLSPDLFLLNGVSLPVGVQLSTDGTRVSLQFAPGLAPRVLTVLRVRDLSNNEAPTQSRTVALAPQPGDMLVNEIMYEPISDPYDGRPDQPEFVEIVNVSTDLLSVRDLLLTDRPTESGRVDTLHLGAGIRHVVPGGFAVIYDSSIDPSGSDGRSVLEQAFPGLSSSNSATLIPLQRLSLRNDGDLVQLSRSDGRLLDAVPYRSDWHAFDVSDPAGLSLERVSQSAASDDGQNWTSSVDASGATPGYANSVRAGSESPRLGEAIAGPPIFSPNGDGIDEATEIRFRLPVEAASLRVLVFDISGRQRHTLVNAMRVGSMGSVVWDGRDGTGSLVDPGIYVLWLEALSLDTGGRYAFKVPVAVTSRR